MTALDKKQRLAYLDVLRVMSTYFVIFMHALSLPWYSSSIDSTAWHVMNIYDSGIRFCVPIFFMISGTLFLNPEKEFPIQRIFSKYILRIMVAFLVWSTFYALLLAYRGEIGKTIDIIIYQILSGHYHMWFLFALLGMYLQLPILRQITKDKKTLEYFLLLSFLMVECFNFIKIHSLSNFWLDSWQQRAQIYVIAGYTGYFLLGHYLNSYPPTGKRKNIIYALGILSYLFTILGTIFLSQRNGYANGFLYEYLMPNTYLMAMAIFVLFQQMKIPEPILKLCGALNPYCFGIYLLHDFFLMFFLAKVPYSRGIYALISMPLFSLWVFLVSFLVIQLLAIVPLFRKTII